MCEAQPHPGAGARPSVQQAPTEGLIPDRYRPLLQRTGLPESSIHVCTARRLPPVARRLLAHERDMTGTLERHLGQTIHLQVLQLNHDPATRTLLRTVLLHGAMGEPAEFGAIRIHLDSLPKTVQDEILESRWPLGALLTKHGVEMTCRPEAFVRIGPDLQRRSINRMLKAPARADLYGRLNLVLHGGSDTVIAEVLEILPAWDDVDAGKEDC